MLTSIIIPTYGAPAQLDECIAAVRANTSSDYELIIIDNGTRPKGYVPTANQGLAAAKGEALVVLNDDALVTAGWLEPLLEALDGHTWVVSPSHEDPAQNWANDRWELNGFCTVLSRECYQQLGGFDEKYTHWLSDCAYPESVIAAGKATKIVLESVVHHNRRDLEDRPGVTSELYAAWQKNDYKDT
jgi:GT2 family glycosyltransferase